MRPETAEGTFEVTARMRGRVEPDERIATLVRSGVREATLDGVPAKLTEVDPWGGVLVRGCRP